MPDFTLEAMTKSRRVVGIDEAGRGPWAGPVVAGAVVLDKERLGSFLRDGLDDSKKLSHKRREELFEALKDEALKGEADVGVGVAGIEEIDALNILEATMLAMKRAVAALNTAPDFALVDGNKTPDLFCPAKAVVKGDAKSLSIAAASIAAKVTRDRMMAKLATEFPGYGWERNAGYGTKEHKEALEALGVTPHHRKSFAPIIKILMKDSR
jgi:ribonuclease HII